MPDQPQGSPAATGGEAPKPVVDTSFLSIEERQQMQRFLNFPEDFPRKFGAWIQDYIGVNGLPIPLSQIIGFQKLLYRRGDAFPDLPDDGQFFGLSVSAGVTWQFRYDATITDAYKWVFMGGPPLEVSTTASASTTGNSNYADYGSALGFTLPNAGIYKVEHGCAARTGNTASQALASVYAGGTPSDDDACGSAVLSNVSIMKSCFVTLASASTTIKQQLRTSNGTVSGNWSSRWLIVTPSRLI